MNNSDFDLVEEFKGRIAPLIEQIRLQCADLGIAYVAAFKVTGREHGESLAVSALLGEPVKGRTSWRIEEALEALQATKTPDADLLEALQSVRESSFGELLKQAIMEKVREDNDGEPCQCPVCKAERGETVGESNAVH